MLDALALGLHGVAEGVGFGTQHVVRGDRQDLDTAELRGLIGGQLMELDVVQLLVEVIGQKAPDLAQYARAKSAGL